MTKGRIKTGIRRAGTPANCEVRALRVEIDSLKQAMKNLLDLHQGLVSNTGGSAVIPPTLQPTPRVEASTAGPSLKRRGSNSIPDEFTVDFPPLPCSHAIKKLARATITPIPLANTFESLSYEEMLSSPESVEIATISEPTRVPTPAVGQAKVIVPKKSTAPKRPPPVILHDVPSKVVKTTSEAIMAATNGKAELRCRGTNISVFTEGNEQWKAVKELASSHKLQFHTYTPRDDRRQAWVMRGAHFQTSPEEIQQELLEKFSITASVSAMTRRMREDGVLKTVAIPLFQVLLQADTNPEKLLQVRTIGCFRVTWEKKRGNRQLTQCYNCQRFGHSASNCGLTHRCVKCTLDHKPGECANTPEQNQKAQCVNCGQEHPANFSECPARVKYLARRAPKPSLKADVVTNIIKKITQPRTIQNPSFTQTGISYAQAATQPTRDLPAASSAPSSFDRLFQESVNQFGVDFFTLQPKCDQFFRDFDRETNPTTRKMMYLRFIATLYRPSV